MYLVVFHQKTEVTILEFIIVLGVIYCQFL